MKNKKLITILLIVGIISMLCVCCCIAFSLSPKNLKNSQDKVTEDNTNNNIKVTEAVNPTQTPTPIKPTDIPKPKFNIFSDGTYIVGTEIKPGTYRTRKNSSNCYYERLSGFGGTLDEILSNDNSSHPVVITIKPTDKGFSSRGCGDWTDDLSQITSSKTEFGDGILIVNTDILPGTYRNSGGSSCYYARLSGFSGELNEIIANDNVKTTAIVTISASDKGFHSSGCGNWKKI